MSDAEKSPDQDTDRGTDPDTDRAPAADPAEGISDEQLPEDLQPGEDNPLAEPLDPDAEETKDPEELDMQGGKPAEQWDDDHLED